MWVIFLEISINTETPLARGESFFLTETGTVVSISFRGANPQLKGVWESAIALIIDRV